MNKIQVLELARRRFEKIVSAAMGADAHVKISFYDGKNTENHLWNMAVEADWRQTSGGDSSWIFSQSRAASETVIFW